MKYIKGDLIDLAKRGNYDIIVHGCNCFNNMGAGIAVAVKKAFPKAEKEDRASKYGDKSKLGKFTIAFEDIIVINAYTQFEYGGGKANVDYDAIREVFRTLNIMFRKKRIGIPLIGAGLAGGDWKIIRNIIEEEATDLEITVVVFDEAGKKIVDDAYDEPFEPFWVYNVGVPQQQIFELRLKKDTFIDINEE